MMRVILLLSGELLCGVFGDTEQETTVWYGEAWACWGQGILSKGICRELGSSSSLDQAC